MNNSSGDETSPDRMENKILYLLLRYDSIIIVSHEYPDGDAFGSSAGFREALSALFPEKRIYCLGPGQGQIVPYACQEAPDDLFPKSLVIVTDTANTARIYDKRWKLGKEVLKIDHHPLQDNYGDFSWVDASFSSCSEMIVYLLQIWNAQIPHLAAELLFAGTVTDTGRFLFPGISSRTFELTACLLEAGIDYQKIYRAVYDCEESTFRFKEHIFKDFQTEKQAGKIKFAYLKNNAALLDSYGLDPTRANLFVELLGDIKDVEVWAFFSEDRGSGKIFAELRSREKAVNAIAAKFGGGGHKNAAGIRLKSWEQVDEVIRVIAD